MYKILNTEQSNIIRLPFSYGRLYSKMIVYRRVVCVVVTNLHSQHPPSLCTMVIPGSHFSGQQSDFVVLGTC